MLLWFQKTEGVLPLAYPSQCPIELRSKENLYFYLSQMLSHSLNAHTDKVGLLCASAHGPVIKSQTKFCSIYMFYE